MTLIDDTHTTCEEENGMAFALFVDNDTASLVMFEQICLNLGIECVSVQKPTELESLLPNLSAADKTIDIIFVDLEMPKMSGYEVLALLRKYPRFATVPIVACTVYGGEIDHAHEVGFNSFIVKPIDIDRFPQQIIAILNHEQFWETHAN